MLLNRHNLALVSLAARNDEPRAYLRGLRIEPGVTVATDGHVIGVVDAPATPDAEYPELQVREGHTVGAVAATVPRDAVADAAKALAKNARQRGLPDAVRRYARVTAGGAGDIKEVEIAVTDSATTHAAVVRSIDADREYPNWRQVMPQGPKREYVAVHVNAKLLVEVLKLAGAFDDNAMVRLSLDTLAGEQPCVVVRARSAEGQQGTWVVAPMRVGDEAVPVDVHWPVATEQKEGR